MRPPAHAPGTRDASPQWRLSGKHSIKVVVLVVLVVVVVWVVVVVVRVVEAVWQ